VGDVTPDPAGLEAGAVGAGVWPDGACVWPGDGLADPVGVADRAGLGDLAGLGDRDGVREAGAGAGVNDGAGAVGAGSGFTVGWTVAAVTGRTQT
jgi:hypothetical protein